MQRSLSMLIRGNDGSGSPIGKPVDSLSAPVRATVRGSGADRRRIDRHLSTRMPVTAADGKNMNNERMNNVRVNVLIYEVRLFHSSYPF
jgi:hypothetical protein